MLQAYTQHSKNEKVPFVYVHVYLSSYKNYILFMICCGRTKAKLRHIYTCIENKVRQEIISNLQSAATSPQGVLLLV